MADVPANEKHNRRRILVITSAVHFFAHFNILIFPAIAVPVMEETGMSLDQVLRLSFFMYLLYGFCGLPSGLIADRWNARGMLIVCAIGMGVACVMAAFSRDNFAFMASLALIGVFASIYHPAGLSVISKAIRDRGNALGINGVFGNFGIALSPFVTGFLTFFMGWRWAYAVPGIIGIASGLLFLGLPVKEDLDDGEETWSESERRSSRGGSESERRSGEYENGYVKYFMILCVALLMGGLAYRGHTLILPVYLEMRTEFLKGFIDGLSSVPYQGTGTLASTILASGAYVVGVLGQIVAGRMADRFDLRVLYLTFHLLSIPLLLMIAVFTGVPLFLAAAAYALFGLGMQPVENSLVAFFTPKKWRSTSYGIKFVLNFGVGSIAVYLVGWIDRAYDLSHVYFFNAIVVGVLVVSIVALSVWTRGIRVRNR